MGIPSQVESLASRLTPQPSPQDSSNPPAPLLCAGSTETAVTGITPFQVNDSTEMLREKLIECDNSAKRCEFMSEWIAFGFAERSTTEMAERFLGKSGPYLDPCQCAVVYIVDRASELELIDPEQNTDGDAHVNAESALNVARLSILIQVDLGFREPHCSDFANRICNAAQPFRFSLAQWIVAFLKSAVYKPIQPPNGSKCGEFYKLNTLSGGSVTGFHQPYFSGSLNPSAMEDLALRLLESNTIAPLLKEGQLFLFSGMSHERAYNSVVGGITPPIGPVDYDFGSGFYLGRHLVSITEHSTSIYATAPALLVFACTKEQLNQAFSDEDDDPSPGAGATAAAEAGGGAAAGQPVRKLDLYDASGKGNRTDEKWQQCVGFFRHNNDWTLVSDKHLKKQLKTDLDYIRGPWSADGGKSKKGSYRDFRADPSADYSTDRRAVAKYVPSGYSDNNEQICIKSMRMANRMDSFLVLAIFWMPSASS